MRALTIISSWYISNHTFFVANKVVLVVLDDVQGDTRVELGLVITLEFWCVGGMLLLASIATVHTMNVMLIVCVGAYTTAPIRAVWAVRRRFAVTARLVG